MRRYERLSEWVNPAAVTLLGGMLILPMRPGVDPNAEVALKAARERLAAESTKEVREVTLVTPGAHMAARLGTCDVVEDFVTRHRALDLRDKAAKVKAAEQEAARAETEVRRLTARLDATPPVLDNPQSNQPPILAVQLTRAGNDE